MKVWKDEDARLSRKTQPYPLLSAKLTLDSRQSSFLHVTRLSSKAVRRILPSYINLPHILITSLNIVQPWEYEDLTSLHYSVSQNGLQDDVAASVIRAMTLDAVLPEV